MEEAGPPSFVLLLNPDTAIRPGAVSTLFEFLQQHARAGVAGARLYYGDGSFQHSAFAFPGLWQILLDLFPLPARLHETRLNGRYPRVLYERGEPFPVDHPLGAAMMVRWDTVRQVGFLDEDFYMYCEEIDWCMRIKHQGWAIYCVPGAEVVHHEGQSTQQLRIESFVNLWRSRRRLYEKHYGPLKITMAKNLAALGMHYQILRTQQTKTDGQTAGSESERLLRAYRAALKALKS
jgi:GT2 family glycosyltransferase